MKNEMFTKAKRVTTLDGTGIWMFGSMDSIERLEAYEHCKHLENKDVFEKDSWWSDYRH